MATQGFTISDGTTSLVFDYSTTDDFIKSDESEDQTTGGKITSQQSGKRYVCTERNIRITGTQFRSLMNLIGNGASFYTYSPNVIPSFMSSTDFPMQVRIRMPTKKGQAWGGVDKKVFYCDLEIEKIDYE